MARKNNRMKTEYHRGLGFDPRKYMTSYSHQTRCESIPTPDRAPKRGDIWFADLGCHPDSSVQGGIRPVIILSNDMGNAHADTVNIVPMTRHLKKPELPCHTHLFPDSISDIHQHLDPSMILAEQLTTVSKHALRSYAGHISDADAMNRIETAVIAQLFLERGHSECL